MAHYWVHFSADCASRRDAEADEILECVAAVLAASSGGGDDNQQAVELLNLPGDPPPTPI